MTINEFIERCNEMGVGGDATIRIQAFGGLAGYPAAESAFIGFDWNRGSVIISTKQALQIKPKAKESK